MYILIEGSKDSYDRPISLYIIGTYDTLKDASEDLFSIICEYDCENEKIFKEAIKDRKTYYKTNYDDIRYLDYEIAYLTYFSTGCPGDNEYCGRTYQILEIGEKNE